MQMTQTIEVETSESSINQKTLSSSSVYNLQQQTTPETPKRNNAVVEESYSTKQKSNTLEEDQDNEEASNLSSLSKASSQLTLNVKLKVSDLNRLFGRENAQGLLQESFLRVLRKDKKRTESAFIHGDQGTGKTSLVMDFKDAVMVTATGYFCSGTFTIQKHQTSKPYSAIIEALDEMCKLMLKMEKKESIEKRQKLLSSTFGKMQLRELSKTIPSLHGFVVVESYNSIAFRRESITEKNKENLDWTTLLKLLRVFCQASKPIVLFLDDLQYADEASVRFVSKIIVQAEFNNCMFVGSYQDNYTGLSWIRSLVSKDHVTDITLQNLLLENVNQLLMDLTSMSDVSNLAKVVMEKTNGNPSSIIRFLEMLQQKELLAFSFQKHEWNWNLELIKAKTNVTENVAQMLVEHIDKLPKTSIKVLHLASMIGFKFDAHFLDLMAYRLKLLESEFQSCKENVKKTSYRMTIQSTLKKAVELKLIGINRGLTEFQFSHGLIQQSFYDEASLKGEREKTHLEMGRIILSLTQDEDDALFKDGVNHLNQGSGYLGNDNERMDLIALNRKIAEKEMAQGSIQSVLKRLQQVIKLLKLPDDWSKRYKLLFQIYKDLAEVAFLCGDMDLSLHCCDRIKKYGRSLSDKLQASYIISEVLFANRKYNKAIQTTIKALEQLGENINITPSRKSVVIEFKQTKRLLKGMKEDDFLSLPSVTKDLDVERMRFLALLAAMSIYTGDDLLAMVFLKMVQNSMTKGFSDFTPFAIAGYGIVSATMGNTQEAINYGKLALALCERADSNVCTPGTCLTFFTFLEHLENLLGSGVGNLFEGYEIGFEKKQVELGANCVAAYAALGFFSAVPLGEYTENLKKASKHLQTVKQDLALSMIDPYLQTARILTGELTDEKTIFDGKTLDERKFFDRTGLVESKDGLPWYNFFILSYVSAYIYNDIDLACEIRKKMKQWSNGGTKDVHFLAYIEIFFSGLSCLALLKNRGNWRMLRQAKQSIKTMDGYAKDGNENCHAMLLLLKAELESLSGRASAVTKMYERAIDAISRTNLIHFHAIANERAADFMMKIGDSSGFRLYIEKATMLYAEWGARAKALQLVEEHELPENIIGGDAPSIITIHVIHE